MMIRSLAVLLAVCGLLAACSMEQMPDIDKLVLDVAAAGEASAREDLAEAFMQQVKAAGTPDLENDTTAVFVYRGPANRVRIMGDMTQWADEIEMERIAGTDVHYYRGTYSAGARLEYLLLLDDLPPATDPLCRFKVLSGLGAHSELAMPGYVYPSVFDSVRTGRQGDYERVERHILPAGIMGYQTQIHVYVPPGYAPSSARYPAVYILDGQDYIEYAHTPAALDFLIESGAIVPVVAVFISPPNRHEAGMPNRTTEYGLNPDYARFMADELVPFVEEHYQLTEAPSARLVAGDSYAGLASVYIPFQQPDVFGLGYSQSGYLSLQSDTLIEAFRQASPKPIRLYVDIGLYERKVGQGWLPDDEIDFLAANRRFREVLSAKGYDYVYREYPEGHTWGNWRVHLIDALVHFFPAGGTD